MAEPGADISATGLTAVVRDMLEQLGFADPPTLAEVDGCARLPPRNWAGECPGWMRGCRFRVSTDQAAGSSSTTAAPAARWATPAPARDRCTRLDPAGTGRGR
jgi:hypothetical protein